MINTTIFKSAFIFLVVISSAISHPVESETDTGAKKSPPTEVTGDHYDQRQNGTKNFRLNVDGVVLVIAPAQALLLASELDPSLLGLGEAALRNAPKLETRRPVGNEDGEKPLKHKSAHSHGLRLSNFLGPLLRHISP